ncbi:MAG: S8 family peptidase [Candidatus Sericytochromatia bacterium]|nr:S8 family peptidase [Candidatus Sericytochromatia bacterium]
MQPCLSLVALVLTACGNLPPAVPTPAVREGGVRAAGVRAAEEILVSFKPGVQAQPLLQRLGIKARARLAALNVLVVAAPDRAGALQALRRDPAVAWAEPNGVVRLPRPTGEAPALAFRVAQGGDPLIDQQWGLAKLEASAAWGVTPGRREVKVGVVDTGIYYKHPEFGDRVDPGFDFINRDDDARDDMMHGTHCAGIVAAGFDDGHGIAGVAPGVRLLAVKVMDQVGEGTWANIADGIVYATQRRCDIINLSLGASNSSYTLKQAVAYAVEAGVLVVAAMGNENTDTPSFPAAYPGVMAVGATKADDSRAGFSNVGAHISVAAPGHRILSTVLYGKYEAVSGTSMAAPHVAGLAALLKSAHPDWTAAQLRARIEATADDLGAPGQDPVFGHGRINARRALTEAR